MKEGDRVLISPQVTGREGWVEGTIIEVEQNPYVGIVITAKTDEGNIFFEKEDLFEAISEEVCLP